LDSIIKVDLNRHEDPSVLKGSGSVLIRKIIPKEDPANYFINYILRG